MLEKVIILARAALNPRRGRVMLKKVVKRITDRQPKDRLHENAAWIAAHCRDFSQEAATIDAALWQEALDRAAQLKDRAGAVLAEAGVEMGGGGFYPMLYFVTRLRKPQVIVETGVAAGFSSQMFLEALQANGQDGRLYSSDFPYFRLKQPERWIGILVEERLRDRWELYVDGDEQNLPRILDRLDTIDLFHYDSDKSSSGRAFAMDRVLPRMSAGGLVVMDDIQDNPFFKDLVDTHRIESFRIYEFEGKFVGVFET